METYFNKKQEFKSLEMIVTVENIHFKARVTKDLPFTKLK
jgi:hypothetical protein